MIDDNVLSKIKKLLAMANRDVSNAHVGEVTNAMTLVQNLLHKHHLSMSSVMAHLDEYDKTSKSFDIVEEECITYSSSTLAPWLMFIVTAVNDIAQTQAIMQKVINGDKTKVSVVYVGEVVDVATAIELFHHLKKSTTSMATRYQKSINGKRSHWVSYAKGCAHTIALRANQIAQQRLESDNVDSSGSSSTDIALYKQYSEYKHDSIMDYLQDRDIKETTRKPRKSDIDYDSYRAGANDGAHVKLNIEKELNQSKNRNIENENS